MTKRRGHRVASDPARRDRSESATQQSRTGDATFHTCISFFFFFLFLLIPIVSVAVYRLRSTPLADTSTFTYTALSVHERGLVKTNVGFRDILTENWKASENTSLRHFPHPVLAYVTPWNSKGYEMAKRFTAKITHLSPVWYDLKSEGPKLVLEGRHNADAGWISELRMKGNILVKSLTHPTVSVELLASALFFS